MPRAGDAVLLAVLVVVLVVALTATLIALALGRRHRRPSTTPRSGPGGQPRAGVIVNPIKIDNLYAYRARIETACRAAGWRPPIWRETTPEDPGAGQTREAIRLGATMIMACGGDGTVRSVACAVAGTGVPLALMPAGTGNLLARNLGIPVTDPAACLRVALMGRDRAVDVGTAMVDISGEDQAPESHTFLVMAGLGFDAEVMASTEPRLKQRVGWWAYVVAGAQHLRGRQTRVVIRMDDQPPLSRRVRSVIVGNCGELTGGVHLMPDARVDDGWLDVVVVAPRTMVGWAAVTAAVLTRARQGYPMVQHFRCRSVTVRAERPLPIQLDGDPVGTGRMFRAHVEPGTLVVRVPES